MRAACLATRTVAVGLAVAVGGGLAVGIAPDSGAGAANVGTSIPPAAFSTRTGITPTSVKVGNISTHLLTLFTGAAIGTEAYADYVNAKGGINGRKIVVTEQDTKYSGTTNAKEVRAGIASDFAFVGSFSVTATTGGKVLAQHPGMPDVSVTVSPATNLLPNLVSPFPLQGGWQEGPLLYFKQKYPADVKKAGELVADQPSAKDAWLGEKATMEHLGYNIVYDNTYPISAKPSTFTTDVIAMKNAGVKILFIEQNPPLYAAPVIKVLNQQNFHPVVVLGASTYSDTLIPTAGGASATDGMYLEQDISLYLGQDQKSIPAVGTFLHWVKVAKPTWHPDLFTLYGWVSAELFAEGLKAAGKNPSRGSLLRALSKVTTFTGTGIQAPTDPAHKTVSNCYLLARIEGGNYVRLTDPPISSSTHGYRCTAKYYVPPGAPG